MCAGLWSGRILSETSSKLKSHRCNPCSLLTQVGAPASIAGLAPYAALLLDMDDPELLQQSSTSPSDEGPEYAEDMRAVCAWVVQRAAAAAGALPSRLLFEWSEGGWQECGGGTALPEAQSRGADAVLTDLRCTT